MVERAVDRPATQTAIGVSEQAPDMVGIFLHALGGQLRRRTEAGAEHRRERAGTDPALLAAAVHEWLQPDPVFDPKRTNALGAVNLVRGKRDQIAAFERQLHAAKTLDRVA